MVYPNNFESKINFNYLRELIKKQCISSMGEANVDKMSFSDDYKLILSRLSETSEMLAILNSDADIPTSHIYDLNSALSRLSIPGSYLSPDEFNKLRFSLSILVKIKKILCAVDEDDAPTYPYLNQRFKDLQLFPSFITEISNILTDDGIVKDDASQKLLEIRGEKLKISASLSSVVKRVMAKYIADGAVEAGTSPSVREGRLVIPVPAMSKRKVKGIVHDESATGKTVYIEPSEIVEANNRLRSLENEEQREIIRILTCLSDFIRQQVSLLKRSFDLLGQYDFIYAKARIAGIYNAQMPVLEEEPVIEWYHAVHPVLQHSLAQVGRAVVPLDITLGQENKIMIISGPNAGGKSVCLKTIGVIQYMVQCGLLPTLYSNSHVGVFKDILIDIGDEQSIENDLSTYSSHLKNMKFFLQNVSNRSLVLVDEMGSGTEPQIGGALAQAIINEFNNSGAFGIITTHYQNLKIFAENTPGIVNAAMLYDRHKMQPLFQLSIGYPGSSFALEIAQKIGLSQSVINNAKEIVGSDYVNMDKYLLDLSRDKRYWANKRLSIKEKSKKLDTLIKDYELKAEDIKRRKSSLMNDARQEAEDLLRQANSKIERTIKEIKEHQADKEYTKLVRKDLEEYRENLKIDNDDTHDAKKAKSKKKTQNNHNDTTNDSAGNARLKVGDYVKIPSSGTVGVISKIEGKSTEVLFGSMRTLIPLSKLTKVDSKPKQKNSSTLSNATLDNIRKHQLAVKQEIDVRGMRVDEALQAITYYLDDVIQFNMSRIRILHGTGTGALRQAIREQLQANPFVKSFGDEDVRFGGAGITVVNFD